MFGINKKIREMQKDPEKALEYADQKLNKGFSGFISKTMMGKDNMASINKALQSGQDALTMQKEYQDIGQTGLPATAVVLSIKDTGKMINYNPVVFMALQVQPQYEPAFETTTEAVVSKIAIPRAGDTINIKYAPADRTKIVVV